MSHPAAAPVRTFHHSQFSPQQIAAARAQHGGAGVSVCLPARECAATVATIVGRLAELRALGVVDEVVVIDAASAVGTAERAREAGATVYQEAELLEQFGAVLGKGDAMWRALSVLQGDYICYLDADSENFSNHFCTGLLGPLLCEPGVQFVKGFYRRPLEQDGVVLPEGGGRVNHLMARPALALFYPQLAAIRQPLAGEVAARRELLQRIPFATGYGVEIAMLIDIWEELGGGGEGFAQTDLELHLNRHQSLQALTPMAHTVLATIARRLQRAGRLSGPLPDAPPERPPLVEVLTPAR
jgi:glucosyl-3-phosphoglycerate synthase